MGTPFKFLAAKAAQEMIMSVCLSQQTFLANKSTKQDLNRFYVEL